ncbi:unnamed protein product [Paramecium sonneborni]|uniref:Uncharacterized protein n=1 Tax=Paramecium sonneborni TaxID=65129 RepID=A0A8S1RCF7_9CILI|nr:unnamed protein product [Paramecium sonneborni]
MKRKYNKKQSQINKQKGQSNKQKINNQKSQKNQKMLVYQRKQSNWELQIDVGQEINKYNLQQQTINFESQFKDYDEFFQQRLTSIYCVLVLNRQNYQGIRLFIKKIKFQNHILKSILNWFHARNS